jgi:HEAT repeat protein
MGDYPVDTTPVPAKKKIAATLQGLDELLGQVARYEYGQSREALVKLEDLMREAYGSPETLAGVESRFIASLQAEGTPAGKDFICRQLSKMGTEASVDTLAEMLVRKETSDMARFALERIPGQKVDDALRQALPKTSGNEKIGIISTLGLRRDSASVSVLAGLINDSDRMVAEAAITALGQIAGPEAIAALKKAKNNTKGNLRTMVLDAYLRCADKLADQGKKDEALAMYKETYQPGESALIRIAALRGMVAVAGEEVGSLLIDILKGNDRQMQAVAIGLVSDIPGEKMTIALTKELPGLPPMGQVQLLSALSQRKDATALPAVVQAAKSNDGDVRVAALGVLSVLGNESTVMLLAEAAANSSGAEQEAARDSLYRLRGAEVDKTIVANLSQSAPAVKAELVRSVGQRSIKSAADLLLKIAQDADSNVRRESFKVLGDIGGAEQISTLVDLLLKAKSSSDRREAEKAVVSVARRSEDAGVAAVLAAAKNVTDVPGRSSLLSVMGKIGSSKALPELRKAINDANSDVKKAAIRALAEWPNAEPAGDLLKIAETDTSLARQVLALRGYVQLVSLPSKRSAEESVGMLKKGLAAAKRTEEKRAILAVLPQFPGEEALQMAQSFAKDAALATEAKLAIQKIKDAQKNK